MVAKQEGQAPATGPGVSTLSLQRTDPNSGSGNYLVAPAQLAPPRSK